MNRHWLLLQPLAGHGALALLATRLLTGAFLIYGVWDNISSAARMAEFSAFLTANGFAASSLMAPLSVYAQLLIGLMLIAGLLTRWAGLALAFIFTIAVVMVHAEQSFREIWPAIILVALGLLFATIGSGRLAFDTLLAGRPG